MNKTIKISLLGLMAATAAALSVPQASAVVALANPAPEATTQAQEGGTLVAHRSQIKHRHQRRHRLIRHRHGHCHRYRLRGRLVKKCHKHRHVHRRGQRHVHRHGPRHAHHLH